MSSAETLAAPLSDTQVERYSRQIILPALGATRQRQLLAAAIAIAGPSAAAAHAALYLAAAGVGHLGVVDAASVAPLGTGQVLDPSNADTRVEPVSLDALLAGSTPPFDAIIDAGASAGVRARLNRLAVAQRVPLVLGTSCGATGAVTALAGHRVDAACAACLDDWPATQAAPADAPADALAGTTAALIGTLLAIEALKCVLDIGTPLYGRVLVYDARASAFDSRRGAKDPACPVCGAAPR